MKRMGIFIFYDSQGTVAPYVAYLLESLQTSLDRLLIVVNGDIRKQEKEKLRKFTPHIFQRENIGYDAGAYKDVFTQYADRKFWESWDEILLLNDTFYGPFYPWSQVFETMQGSSCDFWGLSRHPGGMVDLLAGEVPAHVQSYFLLIRRRMFLHPAFWEFWDRLPYPGSYKEAIRKFEIAFSGYFTEKGFCGGCFAEISAGQKGLPKIPDIYDVETWIRDLGFPVCKRKYYLLHNYIGLQKVFRYLEANTKYPLEAIKEDVHRRSMEGKVKPYNPESIRRFCLAHRRIYLFGMGNHARNIECFLAETGVEVSGYIVSGDAKAPKAMSLKDCRLCAGDGIIVALDGKNCREVSGKLQNRFSLKQLLFPDYGEET